MPSTSSSTRTRELLRSGAQLVLQGQSMWVDELNRARWTTPGMETIAADPVLVLAADRATRSTILQWAAANARDPGAPVVHVLDDDTLGIARALVRRGLDTSTFDAYRLGQPLAWRLWMKVAFTLTSDHDELQELLDVSARSLSEFVESITRGLAEWMQAEREELVRSNHPERREIIALLLEGAPVAVQRAEARLGYRLSSTHIAAVVWTDDARSRFGDLERAVDILVRLSGSASALTIVPGGATVWAWLPASAVPDLRRLSSDLAVVPDVRMALGPAAPGVDGFRRSHLGAIATQRMIAGLQSSQRVAAFDDVQLVSLVTADRDGAAQFVRSTLGALAEAGADIQQTVLWFVREQGSVSRTAARLFVHRNTVLRRMERAQSLLPRPLLDNAVHVAVALESLDWFAPRRHSGMDPVAADKL